LPVWLILMSVMSGRAGNQRELAEAVGIQGATLTHHLNAMEADGLLTRRRDPTNRRIHLVELTGSGTELFRRLRAAAVAHDKQLRSGLTGQDIEHLEAVLDRMRGNVAGSG
jgi:MarR family transcriptional regulator for hemolysin